MMKPVEYVEYALALVRKRAASFEWEVYAVMTRQLEYLKSVLKNRSIESIDRYILRDFRIGGVAVKELEQSEPELAQALSYPSYSAGRIGRGLKIDLTPPMGCVENVLTLVRSRSSSHPEDEVYRCLINQLEYLKRTLSDSSADRTMLFKINIGRIASDKFQETDQALYAALWSADYYVGVLTGRMGHDLRGDSLRFIPKAMDCVENALTLVRERAAADFLEWDVDSSLIQQLEYLKSVLNNGIIESVDRVILKTVSIGKTASEKFKGKDKRLFEKLLAANDIAEQLKK